MAGLLVVVCVGVSVGVQETFMSCRACGRKLVVGVRAAPSSCCFLLRLFVSLHAGLAVESALLVTVAGMNLLMCAQCHAHLRGLFFAFRFWALPLVSTHTRTLAPTAFVCVYVSLCASTILVAKSLAHHTPLGSQRSRPQQDVMFQLFQL